VRKFLALFLTPLARLAGCGGSGTSHGGPPPPPPPPPTQVIATVGPPNVEGLLVDAGPNALTTPAINTPFITVKVCMPGNPNMCNTIDHVEVDTGSIGLRLIASGAPAGQLSLALPAATDDGTVTGNPIAECLMFADGSSWGSVNVADITLPDSGKTAANVYLQVIGASSVGNPPAGCSGAPENTVPMFGANGILGVGPFINDCNSTGDCTPRNPPTSATYYKCPTPTTCATTTVHLAPQQPQQLQNPILLFAADNNGVIIELPAVGANGNGPSVSGALVFGIGTQSNNALSGATKLLASPLSGVITATLNGRQLPNSYLDSGSNANFFADSSLTTCPAPNDGFFCPASTVNESATLQGTDGTMLAANFSVADANTLFGNANYTAFSNVAGPSSDNTSLDLGLSFFYGHNVFTGLEDPNVSPPYFAY